MEQNNYSILIQKLDAFVRKFYTNQLIRGSLLSISVILIAFLTIVLADHYASFTSLGRSVLFFSFVGIFLLVFGFWVIDPLIRYFRLGKVISHEKAATIIGEHFPGVNDKVLNTLQLRKQAGITRQHLDLLNASIEQRVSELKPVPFTAAIDLKRNRRYLRFLLPPAFIALSVFIMAPGILERGTFRLFNYSEEFEIEAPFSFIIENEKLEVREQDDFLLKIKLEGESIPNDVYLETENSTFRLQKEDKIRFSYNFRNVTREQKFRLRGDGFYSKEFTLATVPNPSLFSFEVQLEFPKHTGLSSRVQGNSGDLNVPEGTKAKWVLKTKNTEQLSAYLPDTTFVLNQNSQDQFIFNASLFKSGTYSIKTRNSFTEGKDSLTYFLNVIPDQSPSIEVDEKIDSASRKRLYFIGEVTDDYGFTRLSFNYRFLKTTDTTQDRKPVSIDIPVSRNVVADEFIYFWDLNTFTVNPGDEIEYYFVISDNDGIHGPKSTRSQTRVYKAPSLEEISENTTQNNQEIKKDMEAALREAKKLNQEIDKMQQSLLEKKNMNWEDQQKMQKLLERQQSLQQKIENIQEKNKQNNLQKSEFTQMDPELLEKQQQLEEMFEKLMTDEMKKMYEELMKMLEELNKNQAQENLEEMKMSNEEMEKELDRAMELFKQMEVEQKMEEMIGKLDELQKEQEKLSGDTKDKNDTQENLSKKQEELNKKFDDFKKEMDKLEELNQELETPKNLPDTEEKENEISQEMQKSSEELSDNKNKKASESQKKAAEEMKKMQEQMESSMQSMQMEQMAEDMDALRALLENIIQLSFDQEELMKDMSGTNPKDPKYIRLGQKQRKLKDDAKIVEDSLFALSKRVMQLQSIVNKEIGAVNKNMNESLENIHERRTAQANMNQQYVMTSLNNLALLLDEALQQMQQQMNSASSGNGSCNKPGQGKGGKPKPSQQMGNMKQQQEMLNKMLEQAKKALEEQKKNGNKPGQQGKPGQGTGMNGLSSEELAQMAARQEALRRKLMELSKELNNDGSGAGNQLKEIANDMEKTEEDIVNKNITIETLYRQQEIMTRLLESEKAIREREEDEKRESNEAKNEENSNSFQFLEYKRQKEKELELLRTIPPSLTPYYKSRVNAYFNLTD